MNYFEFHLGDYVESTAHLSMIEDGAYTRLMRKYYATERPLPADLKDVHRLVLCHNAAERAAVDRVLKEFFQLQTDGWHQARCDEEIARYQERQAQQRAASALGVKARLRGVPSGHPNGRPDDDRAVTGRLTTGRPDDDQAVNGRLTPPVPVSNPSLQSPIPITNHHPPLPNSEGGGARKRFRTADEIEAGEHPNASQ